MQKYINNVQDTFGNAIGSVTVTIRDNPGGGLSAIFSDNIFTAKSNPFTNDSDGEFFFYAANGRYDIELTGPITESKIDIRLLDIVSTGTTLRINTDINTATPPTNEAVTGVYEIYDLADDDLLARFGFNGSAVLILQNHMHGGPVRILGEDAGGVARTILDADPDAITELRGDTQVKISVGAAGEGAIICTLNGSVTCYYNSILRLSTVANGVVALRSDGNTDAEVRRFEFQYQNASLRGFVGYEANSILQLQNRIHGGAILISAEDAGGTNQTILNADPDAVTVLRGDTEIQLQVTPSADLVLAGVAGGETKLYFNDVETFRTAARNNADMISGAEVVDAEGNMRPCGLGVIIDDATNFGTGTETPFQQVNAHQTILHNESSATNYDTYPSTGANQTNIPAGAQWEVKNTGTGALTIRPGTSVTLTWFDGAGAAPPTGNRTLARGGRCVVRKISDTNYEIWGVGLT